MPHTSSSHESENAFKSTHSHTTPDTPRLLWARASMQAPSAVRSARAHPNVLVHSTYTLLTSHRCLASLLPNSGPPRTRSISLHRHPLQVCKHSMPSLRLIAPQAQRRACAQRHSSFPCDTTLTTRGAGSVRGVRRASATLPPVSARRLYQLLLKDESCP